MPKVSVIIPVYNAQQYLEQCLNSIIKQSLKDIEIICVNDGSTDNSLNIIKEYAKKDKRVKVISQDNQNAGIARNNGLKAAVGEYIHFLDADDWLVGDIYKGIYTLAEAKKSEIIIFNYKTYNQGEEVEIDLFKRVLAKNQTRTLSFEQMPYFFSRMFVVAWNKVYKRDYLVDVEVSFDNLKCANDRAFYFKTITQATRITLLPKVCIAYRIANPTSLIGSARYKHFYCHFKSAADINDYIIYLPDKVRQFIFDVNIEDILHFYSTSTADNKLALLRQIKKFLQSQQQMFPSYIRKSYLRGVINYLLVVNEDVTNIAHINMMIKYYEKKYVLYKRVNQIYNMLKEY
ncbi:MAG: hypothetical protein BEN18_02230 [Epulopiscium sp. Nuni2H_MBin001]|nr:MAG: hypothetical protein BEN18_02230 [Epulopiscium sp. Nuni2H_MBin001]